MSASSLRNGAISVQYRSAIAITASGEVSPCCGRTITPSLARRGDEGHEAERRRAVAVGEPVDEVLQLGRKGVAAHGLLPGMTPAGRVGRRAAGARLPAAPPCAAVGVPGSRYTPFAL